MPPAFRPITLAGSVLAIVAATGAAAGDGADSLPPFPSPSDIPRVEAIVDVRDFGDFRIAFYREEVPNHVAHFLSLVAEGFYDSLTFHRVIPEFVIQVGDPRSRDANRHNDGAGGGGFRLPPEPSERPVRRGSVVMAWRGSQPGTAGSQWFVSLGDFPEMRDGTVIGRVVDGMDVVDGISQVSTLANRNPYHQVFIESIRLVGPILGPRAAPDGEAHAIGTEGGG